MNSKKKASPEVEVFRVSVSLEIDVQAASRAEAAGLLGRGFDELDLGDALKLLSTEVSF